MIYYCKELDCDNEIHYQTWKYGQGRCRKCADKEHSIRMKDKNNSFFNKKHTEETKRKISNFNKGEGNGHYIDGRCSKIYYCKEEGWENKITTSSAIYGLGRCKSCSKKGNLNPTESGKKNPNYNNHKLAGEGNPHFGKPAYHGKRFWYEKILMRSTWEIKFAQFLDLSGIKWKYEPKRFYFKNYSYCPDFYLPEFNCYIEIKGWWRDEDRKRFNLFKKNYPKENMKVLMKKELEERGVL